MNDDVRAYIENELARGISEADIRLTLAQEGGWSEADLNTAFAQIRSGTASGTPAVEPSPIVPDTAAQTASVSPGIENTPGVDNTGAAAGNPLMDGVDKGGGHGAVIGVLVVVFLVVAGGVSFAFVKGIGPFGGGAPYTQENLISGIFTKLATVDAFSYDFTGSARMEPRDEGARPLEVAEPANAAELRLQYERDAARFDAVSSIVSQLSWQGDIPKTLEAFQTQEEDGVTVIYGFDIVDPLTGEVYDYEVSDDGFDFALTVTFETPDAPQVVRDSSFGTQDTTIIDGQSVTFNRSSPTWYWYDTAPPEPFFALMSDAVQELSPNFFVDFTLSVSTDSSDPERANLAIAFDANADLGDLAFRAGAEMLKTQDDLYLRINNFPSLFGLSLETIRGQWVHISLSEDDTAEIHPFGAAFLQGFREGQADYEENRTEYIADLQDLANTMDKEQLFVFVSAPTKEDVDGESLYRYDLRVNKEAFLPVLEKLDEIARKQEDFRESDLFVTDELKAYLASDEFDTLFEYYNDNSFFTLWVDKDGFLRTVDYSLRIVPGDEATQLADHQMRAQLIFNLDDINQPAEIVAPTESRPIEEVIEEIAGPYADAFNAGMEEAMMDLENEFETEGF